MTRTPDTATDIVRDLALSDPWFIDDIETVICILCDRTLDAPGALHDHAESCPWRRASEFTTGANQ